MIALIVFITVSVLLNLIQFVIILKMKMDNKSLGRENRMHRISMTTHID